MTARPRTINRRIAAQGVRVLGAGITIRPQTPPGAFLTSEHTGGVAKDPETALVKSKPIQQPIPEALEPVLAAMDEGEFQRHVRKSLEQRGWAVFVVPDMRKTRAGLPDIIAMHPKHALLLALELKTKTGTVKPKQAEFRLMAARVPGVLALIVRPADWPALRNDLDDLEARWRSRPAVEEV